MSRRSTKNSFIHQVLLNASWLGVAPLVNRALSLLTLPIMTYYLSPEDYGVWAITSLVVGLVGIFADWGFGVGLTRNYFDYTGDRLKEFLFTIMVSVGFSAGLLYGIAFFVGPTLGELVISDWRPEFGVYLRLQIVATSLTATQAVTTNYLLVAQRPKRLAILQTATNLIKVALQLTLLIVFGLGLFAVYYSEILAGFAMLLIGISLVWHDMKPVFRPNVVREIWSVGWAMLPIAVLGYLVRLGDRWILQSFLPVSSLGLYGFGARFEDMYSMYNRSIKGAWKPVNLRMLKDDSSDTLLRNYSNYLLEISIIVMAGIALFSKEVIVVFANQRFHSAYVVVPILVLGAFFRGVSIVPYNRLIYEKKVPYALITLIPTSITALGLAWLLVPRVGIIGAAIGSSSAYWVGFIIQTIWALRVTERGLQVSSFRWILLLALAVSVSAVGVFQPDYIDWLWVGLKLALLGFVISTITWLEWTKLQSIWKGMYRRYLGSGV